jgi:hypothetical protein
MAEDKCRVRVKHCHREIGKQPGIGGQRAGLHVLYVLGFVSYAAVRVYENRIIGFNALNSGNISFLEDPWPVIFNAQ